MTISPVAAPFHASRSLRPGPAETARAVSGAMASDHGAARFDARGDGGAPPFHVSIDQIRQSAVDAASRSPSEMATDSARALGAGPEQPQLRDGGAAALAPEWPAVGASPNEGRWIKQGPSAIQGPPAGIQQVAADFEAADAREARARFDAAAQGYSSLRVALNNEATPPRVSGAA